MNTKKKSSRKPRQKKVNFECWECGHEFKKTIGWDTTEVKCPKCKGYDTMPK